MPKAKKEKLSFTLLPENVEWIRSLSEKTGFTMSLFVDSLLTGVRMSMKEGVSEREALSIAFDQLSKGLKSNHK